MHILTHISGCVGKIFSTFLNMEQEDHGICNLVIYIPYEAEFLISMNIKVVKFISRTFYDLCFFCVLFQKLFLILKS